MGFPFVVLYSYGKPLLGCENLFRGFGNSFFMFVGKYFYADGDRYEGQFKDGESEGQGNKFPSTPYHPPPIPLPQSNKMFIIIIIAVCGGFPFVVLYS